MPLHTHCRSSSYLNSVLPLGEVDLALALALGGPGSLELGETATELTGELGAEVQRDVLLVLVEQTQLSALVGVDDGENASDRLANVGAVNEKESRVSGRSLKISMFSSKGELRWIVVFLRCVPGKCDASLRLSLQNLAPREKFRRDSGYRCPVLTSHENPQIPVAHRRNPSVESVVVQGCRYRCTHILWVLVEAPLAIFWTRSWLSSVFNSSSCLESSSLFFPQS